MTQLESLISEDDPPGALVETIESEVRAGEQESLDLLAELVSTDSFPEDIPSLSNVVDLMEPVWQSLGFQTHVETTAGGLPVLIADLVQHPVNPTILVLVHLDTVFKPGTAANRPFDIRGDNAHGPGVADMKGGAVVAWLAIRSALKAVGELDAINVRVLNNTDEEGGSVESRPLIEAQAPDVSLALVYEPGRPDGSMVTQRRGIRRYHVTVDGRAAHTGVEPWKGVNAINEAAHKISAIAELNDRDRFLSVTPAVVEGGSRINIVPDHARFDVDVRIPDVEAGAETHRSIVEIIKHSYVEGTSAHYELFGDRPPMVPHPLVDRLVDHMVAGAEALSIDLPVTATGGGSDGCFTSALGVPTLDGLGPVGGGYHTEEEFVRLPTIVERAAVSGLFLARLATGR